MGVGRRIHQLWRTLQAFVPALARPDDAWAARWLAAPEAALYQAMDRRDRAHACAVAKAVLRADPGAEPLLVRAALLHDLGKSERRFAAWERIAAHLYCPAALPAEPRLPGLRGAWQAKLHHPRYGAARVLGAGGCAEVAEIIARHHAPEGHALAERLLEVEAKF